MGIIYSLTPANIYLFKVNNRNSRKGCEICSKLTIKAPEQRHWRRSIFLLLFLNVFYTFSSLSIVHFEQVNVIWHCWLSFAKTFNAKLETLRFNKLNVALNFSEFSTKQKDGSLNKRHNGNKFLRWFTSINFMISIFRFALCDIFFTLAVKLLAVCQRTKHTWRNN